MIRADGKDKQFIVDLLTESFDDNKSVNYIIKGGPHRKRQIAVLMEYSFEVCSKFGDVFLNEQRTACSLVLYPDKKKASLQSIFLNIKLILIAIGFKNIKKVLDREKKINTLYPSKDIFYLWYIAVKKDAQGRGIGTALLKEICTCAATANKDIYLETSAEENIRWYKKLDFDLYRELDFTYTLSCFRKKTF
jgi:hypothetical protein